VQAKPSTNDLNVANVIKVYIQTFPSFPYISPKFSPKTRSSL